ncbi:MAG: hypothetical protein ACLSFT_12445, partial [Ruminococcus callidus]
GLTTLNAAALDKKSITHKADMTPEALAELLGTTLEKMLQNSCLTYENLLGIGVGIMPSAFEMMGGSTTDTGCPAFPVLQKALEDAPACLHHQQCRHRIRRDERYLQRPVRRKIRSFCTGTAAVTCHSRQRQRSHMRNSMMPLWNTSVSPCRCSAGELPRAACGQASAAQWRKKSVRSFPKNRLRHCTLHWRVTFPV